jgi:heme/copper-type cytochrome/quinol oxidase subunit 3
VTAAAGAFGVEREEVDGDRPAPRIDELPEDEHRGTLGMALGIATEALLFVCLFFAYFYVGHRHPHWPQHPPEIGLAVALLIILLASSGTLHAAEKQLRKGEPGAARLGLIVTILLGVVFAVVQVLEYRNHLVTLQPRTDSYGSLFYAITTFHALHVAAGLLMLIFVACLPTLKPAKSPQRPLHNAALYWHFVDVVWVFVVVLLYLVPWWEGHHG